MKEYKVAYTVSPLSIGEVNPLLYEETFEVSYLLL